MGDTAMLVRMVQDSPLNSTQMERCRFRSVLAPHHHDSMGGTAVLQNGNARVAVCPRPFSNAVAHVATSTQGLRHVQQSRASMFAMSVSCIVVGPPHGTPYLPPFCAFPAMMARSQ